jgi:hypothetical protein
LVFGLLERGLSVSAKFETEIEKKEKEKERNQQNTNFQTPAVISRQSSVHSTFNSFNSIASLLLPAICEPGSL